MNRSWGGDGGETSGHRKSGSHDTSGDRFVSLGVRLTRRPLFTGSLLSLTALAVGAGLSLRGPLRIPGMEHFGLRRLAAAAERKPVVPDNPQASPGPNAPPAEHPPGTSSGEGPQSLPPDPRFARALNTRVHLQAGKASLWTELPRLGVSLAWADAGEPQWTVDERLFNRAIRRFARRIEHQPRNARLVRTGHQFHALPAHPGRMLDRTQARQQLLAALAAPAFRGSMEAASPAKPAPITLALSLRQVPPKVTAAHLGSMNTLLAAYSTSMGGSSRNRRHNIQVACQAIDGTVLLPGEVFSYNDIVGPRSERAGFRTAPVIIRGELVPGTGGGICQVSSTLYNLALLGGLKIVRRSHHQFPVHYVPPGRDATVAYGSLDLRFANSLPHPIALDVKTAGSRVVVHLYGCADCKRDVRLVSSRVSWTRPRAPAGGGPARPGKRVTVSRIVRLPDGSERREVISHDSYAPAPPSAHSLSTSHRRSHRRYARPRGLVAARHSPAESDAPTLLNTTAAVSH
jgi:vancomycin resistance protein YoaR